MTTPAALPADPASKVEQARLAWIRRLIDLSRRNNLLFFRDLKKGTLDFSNSDLKLRAALLRGESVVVKKLLPDMDPERLGSAVDRVRAREERRELGGAAEALPGSGHARHPYGGHRRRHPRVRRAGFGLRVHEVRDGLDGGAQITAEELATWAGTIPHEILTNINTRVPRVYKGKIAI